jgi:cytochrome c oxidase subunit II
VTRDKYIDLFDIYWPIALAVGVLVVAATLFVVWRYRASRVGESWPRGRDENLPVELAYAVGLAAIVALLVYFTFSTQSDLDRADAQPAGETIAVTGARWNWRFAYPRYGIASEGSGAGKVLPTLTVPSGTAIRFRGTSDDVMHSFYIPHERFKRDVFPGRTTTWTLSFSAQDEGMHRQWGVCAEFCGAYHAYMKFDVEVLSPDEFRAWVQEQRR